MPTAYKCTFSLAGLLVRMLTDSWLRAKSFLLYSKALSSDSLDLFNDFISSFVATRLFLSFITTSLVDLMCAKMRELLSCTHASLKSGRGSLILPSSMPPSLLFMIVCASFMEWMLASFQRSDETSMFEGFVAIRSQAYTVC